MIIIGPQIRLHNQMKYNLLHLSAFLQKSSKYVAELNQEKLEVFSFKTVNSFKTHPVEGSFVYPKRLIFKTF